MNAIPTKYNGVQFRSRLEAKWAAFFDVIGWKWDYEPIDLAGYIPDFIVHCPWDTSSDSERFLVEIKPIVHWPCPVVGCTSCSNVDRTDYDAAIAKIKASGWTGEALIGGAAVFRGRLGHGGCTVEATARYVKSKDWWWESGAYDFARTKLVDEWRRAGNLVQWRGAEARP